MGFEAAVERLGQLGSLWLQPSAPAFYSGGASGLGTVCAIRRRLSAEDSDGEAGVTRCLVPPNHWRVSPVSS
jgi:hypothetical protein